MKISAARRFFSKTILLSSASLLLRHRSLGTAVLEPAEHILGSKMNWAEFVEPNFPFFSTTLDARKLGGGLPSDNLTPRGLILNLGHNCWACFDTDLLRMSVIWVGAGVSPASMAQISYHSPGTKAVEGEEHLPRVLGAAWIATGIYPGWQVGAEPSSTDPREPGLDRKEIGRGPLPVSMGQFEAVRLTAGGLRLEYTVAGTHIVESVEARIEHNQPIIARDFRVEKHLQPLWLILGRASATNTSNLNIEVSLASQSGDLIANKFDLANPMRRPVERLQRDGAVVHIEASNNPLEFQVVMALGPHPKPLAKSASGKEKRPASAFWPQTLTTRAALSSATSAYVVDNIPLPLDNPWGRNIRLADLAFFQDGRAAAVTFDGDVWIITGLRDRLDKVQWRRFASGLQEPLGLCIRNNQIFVNDRNGIWRLLDTDGNGEADVYEMFSNVFAQSAETREYAQGIRTAPDGSFIIAKGGIEMSTLGKQNGSVLRVAPDGKSSKVIGYGFRSPFIGVHPKTGLITASDQQGNYVPATPLQIVRDHQFYGFLSNLLPKEKYPAPIAEPLTWIPYPVNASGAGQVWLVGARMGPLNDSLVHIAYYRPELFSVPLNQRGKRMQGAVVSLTRDLEFPPFNGAVNPLDGQLYVTGFQIFGSEAKQISGLARIRYTGSPSTLPREVAAMDKGIMLRFDLPLNPRQVAQRANFSAERWNYLRTANYGSPHFKMDGTKGQESMRPSSVYLSRDHKSIFIGIPNMKPVMQMRLGWALETSAGVKFEQNAYFTPYDLTAFDPSTEGFDAITVDLTPQVGEVMAAGAPITIEEGRRTAELMGCVVCHSNDGTTLGKAGPTWRGLFESDQSLSTGIATKANEAYLRESILEPSAKIVRGYEKSETAMPSYNGVLSGAQIESLILYIKALK